MHMCKPLHWPSQPLLCCLPVVCLWLYLVTYVGISLWKQKIEKESCHCHLRPLRSSFGQHVIFITGLEPAGQPETAVHTDSGHIHTRTELPVQNNRYKYSSLWEKEYKHSVHPCSEEEHPVQCFLFSEAHTEKSTLSYSPRSQTDVNQLVSSVRRDSHDRPLC